MKISAAQMMLDLPSRLRRFCAAAVEKNREHWQPARRQRDEIRLETPPPEAPGRWAVDYVFWKGSFCKLISAEKGKPGLTFPDGQVMNRA
jgi:hypothetical protein